MKRNLFLAAVTALAVVSCSSDTEPAVPHVTHRTYTPRAPRVVAMPGRAPVAVQSEDVDDAFERQVNAYANQQDTGSTAAPYGEQTYVPTPYPVQPVQPVVTPQPVQTIQPVQPVVTPTLGGAMNYKVQITNMTTGRIFVEAQDASGAIYPCGFMDGKDAQTRSYTTPMENAAPIKGPITVVVRDPDKEGSPEIRRYKVNPPSTDYANKTVNISIMPGGLYLASVDGQVYYQSLPETPKAVPARPAPATGL